MSAPFAMTLADRLALLIAPGRVGIVTVPRPGAAAPLASPVWFDLEGSDGTVRFVTAATSEKARLLAGGVRASFIVQDETPPQRFAALAGVARVAPADRSARRAIAARYLPAEAIDSFMSAAPDEDLVLVTITPDTWWSSDFGKSAVDLR